MGGVLLLLIWQLAQLARLQNEAHGWRLVLAACFVIDAVVFYFFRITMAESPFFLRQRGRLRECAALLAEVAEINDCVLPDDDQPISQQVEPEDSVDGEVDGERGALRVHRRRGAGAPAPGEAACRFRGTSPAAPTAGARQATPPSATTACRFAWRRRQLLNRGLLLGAAGCTSGAAVGMPIARLPRVDRVPDDLGSGALGMGDGCCAGCQPGRGPVSCSRQSFCSGQNSLVCASSWWRASTPMRSSSSAKQGELSTASATLGTSYLVLLRECSERIAASTACCTTSTTSLAGTGWAP